MMLKRSHFRLCYLIKLIALSAFTLTAQADLIGPGALIGFNGTSEQLEPELAGTMLVDEMISFSFSGRGEAQISGMVQQRVVRSSLDNSIDFYWRVVNDPSSTEAISYFHLLSFDAPEYNPNWRSDWPGDKAPVAVFRHFEPFESNVDFEFGFGYQYLDPGTASRFFFLNTTAMEFAKTASFTLANFDHSAESNSFSTYEPRAVPLPAAVWLFAIGLGMLGRLGGFRL